MADLALYRNLDFNTVECYSCGCIFALPGEFYTHRHVTRRNGIVPTDMGSILSASLTWTKRIAS